MSGDERLKVGKGTGRIVQFGRSGQQGKNFDNVSKKSVGIEFGFEIARNFKKVKRKERGDDTF